MDKKEGHGVLTTPEGHRYEGSYRQNLRHGWGRFTWKDGEAFEGSWRSGGRWGEGTLFRLCDGSLQAVKQNWQERVFDKNNKGTVTSSTNTSASSNDGEDEVSLSYKRKSAEPQEVDKSSKRPKIM